MNKEKYILVEVQPTDCWSKTFHLIHHGKTICHFIVSIPDEGELSTALYRYHLVSKN